MSSRVSAYIVPTSLVLTAVLAFASLQAAHSAPQPPKIEARSAPLLKVGEQSFKDLNRNGALDPYED